MSASIRDVRRRIRSVASTKQMTQAMKTVAVSKHNRAREKRDAFLDYDRACRGMLDRLGDAGVSASAVQRNRVIYLVLTANRGLCGSFHADLLHALEERLEGETREVGLVVCGKWGRTCFEERGDGRVLRFFPVPDLPDSGTASEIAAYLTGLYRDGEASEIRIIGQQFENLLRQVPEEEIFLPRSTGKKDDEAEVLFLSDRETVLRSLTERTLDAVVYRRLLDSAVGAHAAMLVAMRTANDSSEELLEELTQSYHRLRQAAVTTEVLELAGNGENHAGN